MGAHKREQGLYWGSNNNVMRCILHFPLRTVPFFRGIGIAPKRRTKENGQKNLEELGSDIENFGTGGNMMKLLVAFCVYFQFSSKSTLFDGVFNVSV